MNISIIGAGIGGLTLANLLEKKGISYSIYDQFKEFKEKGAGIILAPNALAVFNQIRLTNSLQPEGQELKEMAITDHAMRDISRFTFAEMNLTSALGIHRGRLQSVLLKGVPKEKIFLDHQFESIEGATVTFKNGSSAQSNLIVGADGIHSKIRQLIMPTASIRPADQSSWRGVTAFSIPNAHEGKEMWGRGLRFGFVPIDDKNVYWYAVSSITPNDQVPDFGSFHPLVNQIIRVTPKSSIIYTPLADLKPIDRWFDKNVVLLGDAAHATTPNLGQGACQAIEDALALANALSSEVNVESALKKYQTLRLKKAHHVVNTSWQLGKIAHWTNPVAMKFRNALMRNSPKRLLLKRNLSIYDTAYLSEK